MNSHVLIDADNALGSWFGDVDDAFAIAALLRSAVPVAGISSVAGNTSERLAFLNNSKLARRLEFTQPVIRGSEVPAFLSSHPAATVVALGPLTNVAAAIRDGAVISRVILVGGNLSTRGRWPPWWPHEFNQTRDRRAALDVFRSDVELTIFPLDVARQLVITSKELAAIEGEVAAFLAQGSKRWFTRLRLLKGTRRFPVYDLAAALYAIDSAGFTMDRTMAVMHPNTLVTFGAGTRPVDVCRSFDPRELLQQFRRLLANR